MSNLNLLELLDYIDPTQLTYQEWIDVGFALKSENYTASDWDDWSKRDNTRYRPGECFKKWTSFEGSGITGATITKMAKDNGWTSPRNTESHELDWNDEISLDEDYKIIDKNWIEGKEIIEPVNWNPVREITRYLETLFQSTEHVGYVTETYEIIDDKTGDKIYKPTSGASDRTAGQLIEALNKCDGDIGAVLGDYKEEAGAWIRFNPLDGKGVKNDNVSDYRYTLVESDNMDIEKQNAIMRELELPIAILVHSGKRSIHAIVKVDAGNYEEYRKRVDYLYNVCKKNGLNVDNQNRNPSRLSRLPGIVRNGKKQFIIDTHIGKSDWDEWHEWIEDLNDDLPDMECLEDFYDNLPELAPPLIEGLLRQGHKMLMAGPSKAGKSFALIELAIAIAEGAKWLNWKCTQGHVLYVNLELDRASALHRFKDVYAGLGLQPRNIRNIDIWNLRGKSVPMDKLAPKLIRRAHKKGYIAVIIDPIYKVLTGDENSADQMAHFTNQFDKIATELGSSVIYCHHHSKGTQGGKKSMDRASGSGVFARDPDALIDLVELDITDDLIKQQEGSVATTLYANAIQKTNYDYFDEHVGLDDQQSVSQMNTHAKRVLTAKQLEQVENEITNAIQSIRMRSAWRVEGTLREYPKFEPVNMWFQYPVHKVDETGFLKDIKPEGDTPPWKKNFDKKKTPAESKQERKVALETAFDACGIEEKITVKAMAEYMGIAEKTVRNRIKEHGGFWVADGEVGRK
ncbi:AAA family ATPase [Anaerobacillus isosaccharinicus]|uniref:AAA family ATPase n=1 Tax=Anaerobacillus isosaccharinicus TaxID=1532552 RepID=A0A1S2LBC7_9BACI|nr:AAA family ATPase [Anaerobacillus isosaccharinicus]MBA5584552.1 AAA family ATPase [Anaerobacillus isosaccharinicus]QOY37064.1 AAA family ATPase [Anaerobacillus isosaccharinicus]